MEKLEIENKLMTVISRIRLLKNISFFLIILFFCELFLLFFNILKFDIFLLVFFIFFVLSMRKMGKKMILLEENYKELLLDYEKIITFVEDNKDNDENSLHR